MSTATGHKNSRQESISRRHEVSDVDFGRVMITGFGLLGVMILGLAYSVVVESFFSGTTAQPGAPAEIFVSPVSGEMPPLPRIEPDPHANLVLLQRREDSLLTRYGWVSRDSGLVRVPIERAMELVIEKKMLGSR